MENQRLLLIGGGGYLGSALAEKLSTSGFDLTVLLRKKIIDYPYKYLVGDLLVKEDLYKLTDNFEMVIDLASVVRTINKRRYLENQLGLSNLIEVMTAKNLKRLIYFSSQNVNLHSKGPYAKSKEACEKLLTESTLDYMIIRPSLIYGIDRQNDFYRLIRLIDRWHLAPIIGSGENTMEPVLKDDVADLVVDSVINFKSKQIIEVVGNESVSMNQIIDYISRQLNIVPLRIHLNHKILLTMKNLLPFDISGYTEDRKSKQFTVKNNKTSFFNRLEAILDLYQK